MPVDLEVAQRYAELGVHRLIVRPSSRADGAAIERLVGEEMGDTLVGKVWLPGNVIRHRPGLPSRGFYQWRIASPERRQAARMPVGVRSQ